jgi:hypothetical protein
MATGGRAPPHALRHPWVWGVAVGPTLVSPPPSVFHASLGAARHSDRCRATALELALLGHVTVSPPTCNLCAHAAFTQQIKTYLVFPTPFWLKYYLE